jgi:hypothetical protein
VIRFEFINLLKSPADRQIINRWTRSGSHELLLPQPADPDHFQFLVIGDTGDSEASGPDESPQDAVARFLAADAALPASNGRGELVLHLGDVIYMTGERRLYDRNFRRPYAPFLTPESTARNLVFRLPFLPVPGNHDYYDLTRWARILSRTPGLGEGIRTIARELFSYSLSVGGSDQGRAFMESFIHPVENGLDPVRYLPGLRTRLPNRYYHFRYGSVDFFALDTNTLEAPLPGRSPHARRQASRRVRELTQQARAISRELRRDRRALDRWNQAHRREMLAAGVPQPVLTAADQVASAIARLCEAFTELQDLSSTCEAARSTASDAHIRWTAHSTTLSAALDQEAALRTISELDTAAEYCRTACRELDDCVAQVPDGAQRQAALRAGVALSRALRAWALAVNGSPPAGLRRRLQELAEKELDAQRELARERQRAHSAADDFDSAQLEWLDRVLEDSVRERPGGWRVVYLHHPLYTTTSNHCERSDVQGVRQNLLARLRGRAHLVLAGHSHAFEWLHSQELPHTGLFVSGGGGQVTLRGSVLDPRRFRRYRDRYAALRSHGVDEAAVAGWGTPAIDDESGPLYHYLRVEVTPDALVVYPVGVRRVGGGYRREEPMPVHHAPDLPAGPPPWVRRQLRCVRVYRDRPPEPIWHAE